MASLAHIGGIVLSFIAPLIIWLWKREDSAFIADQAKEATNFQITVAIVLVGLVILTFIPFIGCLIPIAMVRVWIASIIGAIVGAMKSNEGVLFRYPATLRLIN